MESFFRIDPVHFTHDNFVRHLLPLKDKWVADGDYFPYYESMFNNLDMNRDGVITYNEWVAHYNCMGIDTEHARASFEAMNQSGDGKVSRDEFVTYHYEFFNTTEDKRKSSILYGPLD